jgi:hypothetical protein
LYRYLEEIANGEPRLRVGKMLPQESVNLAYISGPVLNSAEAIELFDYSRNVPENTTVYDVFETKLFASTGRLLCDQQGKARIPIEDVVLTGLYKDNGGGDYTPLFYYYKTRFCHYEKNPPLSDIVDGNVRIYKGQNIKVKIGGSIVTDGYVIGLQATKKDGVWMAYIYSVFISSKENIYTVSYSKCTSDGTSVNYGFEEVCNSTALYEKTSLENVKNAPDGTKVFALEKTIAENGYRVYAAKDVDSTERFPVIFRWRVVAKNGMISYWKSDTVLNPNLLFDDDFDSEYFKDGNLVWKKICEDITTIFTANTGLSSLEKQIWSEGEWVDDSDNKVILQYLGNVIVASTQENTGTSISGFGTFKREYPLSSVPLTFEAWLDPPDVTVTPIIATNVASSEQGATVTSDLRECDYPEHSDPVMAIDGGNPATSAQFGLNGAVWYGRTSKIFEVPAKNPVTTTVNLAKATLIHELRIIMGGHGSISKLEVVTSNGSVISVWAEKSDVPPQSPNSVNEIGRKYIYRNNAGISDVTQIILTVEPYFWREGISHKSQFDIHEIVAINEYNPPDVSKNWYRKVSKTFTVGKNAPTILDAKNFLSSLGLIPEGYAKSNLRYRVLIGDYTYQLDGSNIRPVNPYISINFIKDSQNIYSSGYQSIESDEGEVIFSYDDLSDQNMKTVLCIFGCEEQATFSKLFALQSRNSGKGGGIHILPFDGLDPDEIWRVAVNNGRTTREKCLNVVNDIRNNLFLDYYLPEFERQAFFPVQPYMYSEEEEVSITGVNTVKITHIPMAVECDNDGNPVNLKIYIDVNGIETQLRIENWNIFTGEITVDYRFSPQDLVYADYYYEMTDYIYKGYSDISNQKFFYLDLNPMPGHFYSDKEGNLRPSIELLDKKVYLYILPSFIYNEETCEADSPEGCVLRHLIVTNDVTEETVLNQIYTINAYSIVLGRISLSRASVPSLTTCIDARQLGGGFKPELSNKLVRSLHKEAESVWDAGCWDGKPYPSNGVIEISLPKGILKVNDPVNGKFTEEEVREIINQYVAYGTYVFVQYV